MYTLIALITAALFYVLVPGLGAFRVRAGWRAFRRRMVEAAGWPILTGTVAAGGPFRLFGRLEAIQGSDRVWLRSGPPGAVFSVAAELGTTPVYLLPPVAEDEGFGDEEPQRLPWRSISTLPAGTQMFVAGALSAENGRGLFEPQPDHPLLAVLYEGDAGSILPQAVRCGRQRNEYWNSLTGISLITGFMALAFLGYSLLRFPLLRFPALLAFALAMAPAAAFLPPGVPLLFLYRRLWKKARSLRAERDLLNLPLRWFPETGAPLAPGATAQLPTGERYVVLSGPPEELRRLAASPPQERNAGDAPGPAFLLGVRNADGRTLQEPQDPMARLVLIHGEPRALSAKTARVARRTTALAALLFALGLLPNLALVLLALSNLVL